MSVLSSMMQVYTPSQLLRKGLRTMLATAIIVVGLHAASRTSDVIVESAKYAYFYSPINRGIICQDILGLELYQSETPMCDAVVALWYGMEIGPDIKSVIPLPLLEENKFSKRQLVHLYNAKWIDVALPSNFSRPHYEWSLDIANKYLLVLSKIKLNISPFMYNEWFYDVDIRASRYLLPSRFAYDYSYEDESVPHSLVSHWAKFVLEAVEFKMLDFDERFLASTKSSELWQNDFIRRRFQNLLSLFTRRVMTRDEGLGYFESCYSSSGLICVDVTHDHIMELRKGDMAIAAIWFLATLAN